jgi:hypothetical protein
LSDEQFFLPNFYNIRISGRLHMYFDSVGADYAATRIAVGISKDFNLHEYSFTGGELCFYCLGDGSMSFDLSLPLYGQQAVGLDFLRGRVAPFVEVSATVILPVDEPSTITLAIAAIGVFSVCGRTRFVASNR